MCRVQTKSLLSKYMKNYFLMHSCIKLVRSMLCLYTIFLLLQLGIAQPAKRKDWSYFVFAQKWPPAACLEVPHGKCLIPKGVTEWTVHGLWPTSKKGYPSFCNSSWHFKPELIKPILLALEVKWPNIYADASENAFWKHEWMKHGTCAASEEEFDSELKYFKNALTLHDGYNIFEYIRKAGLNPDGKRPHLLKLIENSITFHLNKTVKLFCKNHKGYSSPVLTSMYVCTDKKLNPIDCDEITEKTCDKAYVYYLPFSNQTL